MTGVPASSPRRLRRTLGWLAALALLAWLGAWSWQQPFLRTPRMLWTLSRMPAPAALPMPVQGVRARQVADTFGAPRGRDRRHAGVDIFARRGTPVLSSTAGVVIAVRDAGLGGRQAWVFGPAGQRHYYAHLDGWAPGLANGQVVARGQVLGFVGDSGNARGTPTHLHYGVYAGTGALDPLPLLRAWR